MTISRRSFARSIIASVAGATVLRQAATPLTPTATAGCRAFTAEEICKIYDVPVSLVSDSPRTVMDKDYWIHQLREEWRWMHVGPRNVTTLPGGWEMRQYGPYKAADGQPAVFWDHA
jgi:hypothetical protein